MNQRDYERVNRSPINTSQSKMLYSFSKAQRFSPPKPGQSRRTTSLGIGNKILVLNHSSTPSPQQYQIPSAFSGQKGKGFKFGLGREYIYQPKNTKAPGPGHYPQPSTLGKISFSIRPKLSQSIKSDIPGPGQYDIVSCVQQKYPLSTYRNILVPSMKGSARGSSLDQRNAPGPGQYQNDKNMTQSQRSAFFPKEKRELFRRQKSRDTPGVGNYEMPSEFGSFIKNNRLHTIQ